MAYYSTSEVYLKALQVIIKNCQNISTFYLMEVHLSHKCFYLLVSPFKSRNNVDVTCTFYREMTLNFNLPFKQVIQYSKDRRLYFLKYLVRLMSRICFEILKICFPLTALAFYCDYMYILVIWIINLRQSLSKHSLNVSRSYCLVFKLNWQTSHCFINDYMQYTYQTQATKWSFGISDYALCGNGRVCKTK